MHFFLGALRVKTYIANSKAPDQTAPDLGPHCLYDKISLAHALRLVIIIEQQHEISKNEVCMTSKASDQPAHTCSLIRAFACCLDIL